MKKWVYLFGMLVYLLALSLSAIIAVKPGASIFYLKTSLLPENFSRDAGFSYRCLVSLSPAIFPPDRALLFEDGQQLERGFENNITVIGNGLFETITAEDGGFYVYISPIGNSDPSSDGKTYQLYSASSLLSQSTGIVYFSTLLFGVLHFLGFAVGMKERSWWRSLKGIVQIIEAYAAQLKAAAARLYCRAQAPWTSRRSDAGKLLVITAAAAYGLILMEWIFHVTKVSFMDSLSLGQKLEIFLLSGLALAVIGLCTNLVLLLAERLLRPLRLAWLPASLQAIVPALLLTCLVVLWLDSFTYTVFHFGILTAVGFQRMAYGVLVVLLFWLVYHWLFKGWGLSETKGSSAARFRWLRGVVLGLLGLASILAVVRLSGQVDTIRSRVSYAVSGKEFPNIILIGSDGVSAKNMSVYGYSRETTPYIEELAEVSLVAENAFTNSGNTYGSILSLLTGKMPTSLHIIYPPDILHGNDSYQHLPGILKNLGYTTAQIGVSYFVDAKTWNIQHAFDSVNQRTVRSDVLVFTLNQFGFDLPALFVSAIEERLTNRLFQALYVETIQNPYSVVTEAPSWQEDRKRIDNLLALLENTPEPLFVHVHLMGTHGTTFFPALRTFSKDMQQDEEWMIDFYDDAILTYDAYIGELVDALKASGQFDRTIFILYSDHAMQFQSKERIPLIIHFPGQDYQQRIKTNVQNLDIAPTLLDYLEIPVPEWMEGDSILQFHTQVREPLFSVVSDNVEVSDHNPNVPVEQTGRLETENYRLAELQVLYCQRVYQLDLVDDIWREWEVDQHTAPCSESDLLDLPQASQALVEFLASQGYDTSVIP